MLESSERLFEAPNWTHDGTLLLNADGGLWRLELSTGDVSEVAFTDLPEINNDHVLSMTGDTIYLSANDGHIYEGAVVGGAVRRVTSDVHSRKHFLHGVSPAGDLLAYIGVETNLAGVREANVFTLSIASGESVQLTFGDKPSDGSEFSPDGEWIYFNTERFSSSSGHAQIARMPSGGGAIEQLTFDDGVNWFPHLSPDGASVVFLTYPPGTVGHPADRDVALRLAPTTDFAQARDVARLTGGQGTINVHSWAPDSRRFAFVEYPTESEGSQ